MSLFDSLGNGKQQAEQMTPQKAMEQLRYDPVGVLKGVGLNIPSGMNNPQQIVQHLMQSGQVPQNKFAQAMQMMMGRR